MKNIFCVFIATLLSICACGATGIVQPNVESLYQPNDKIALLEKDVAFWSKKIIASPNQSSYLIKLATTYAQSFSLTGVIGDLKKAEQLLQDALAMPLINRSSVLRGLAHNYITQHRFCEALEILQEAVAIGENNFANDKMLFDIYMELGDEEQARIQLTKITNESSFDYLIRKSKWEDSKGNLSKAISYLEQAKKKAIASNNKSLIAWSFSNLGDYYGHNGEIEKSYTHFMKTLELDPANWYALKGIAWIAYSHDRNIDLSKEILQTIIEKNNSPDLYLELAEVEAYKGKKLAEENAIEAFQKAITNKDYGNMYNKYECLIAAEDQGQFERAYNLALQEVENRPTVASYDLLAWTLYLEGKKETAQIIAKKYVLGKTSEPDILLHLAYIFYSDSVISNSLLREIATASFELGPLKAREIDNLIVYNINVEGSRDWKQQFLLTLINPFWFLG